MLKLGVTGGIGSGKTFVCTIISAMGYPVFNADYEAKMLINNDIRVINAIKNLFGDEIYINSELNRTKVAELVFSNPVMLEKLNSIVHPVVKDYFNQWANQNISKSIVVKEAAILFESGANIGLDKVIGVVSPLELRIKRVIERDNTSYEAVLNRIKNQYPQEELIKKCDYIIENDGVNLLLPQIIHVIDELEKVL